MDNIPYTNNHLCMRYYPLCSPRRSRQSMWW